jgi:16S rRNA C967 or C1407 C5-methylase (RsmB/RsmF family)/NOL1/NOP2/fmu family ribosome biogenesis protein
MYPVDFTERLKRQNYIEASMLEKALDQPSPVSIRVNPAKWNFKPDPFQPVQWCTSGYYLESRPSYTSDPLFHSGCYYPQEASSMFLEHAFSQLIDNSQFIKVLDLCGAPGGKSTHLSSLIGDRGILITNEVIKARAGILAENITKWGTGNTIVTNNDPEAFSTLEGYFDIILVDAPCSGEGMFRDQVARSEWSSGNAALCSDRQKRILMDVWPSLKNGGILIYSTCTFNPAENEENIKWLSEKTGASSVRLDIQSYNGIKEISLEGITGYGFYPGKIIGEGLFISVVRKESSSSMVKIHPGKQTQDQMTRFDRRLAEGLIDSSLGNLYRHNDIVYELSLPVTEYHFLLNHLRIIKGGTALFKSRKDDFTPLHELALYSLIRNDAFPSKELDYEESLSFLKKEGPVHCNCGKGWVLMKYRNVNLGFIKNLGNRINNYFPVEWRIRMNLPSGSDPLKISWNIGV